MPWEKPVKANGKCGEFSNKPLKVEDAEYLVTWSDFQINNPVAPTADFTIFSLNEKAIGQR